MHLHYRHQLADILPREEGLPPTPPPPPPPPPQQLAPRAPLPEPSSQSGESSNSSEVKTNVSVLPVVLGAGVPILIAICILIYLHRRHVRRLRREDANDKHRSLDFGLDIVDAPSRSGGGPMQEAEKGARVNHSKGMSLDINHPYLMPADLHASQESFMTGDKPRHPDSVSTMSHSRGFQDDASSFRHPKSSLYMPSETTLNARRMSRAGGPGKDAGLHFDLPPPLPTSTGPNPFGDDDSSHHGSHLEHEPEPHSNQHLDDQQRHYSAASSSGESDAAGLRKSNAHLALAIDLGTTDLDPFKHPDELNESGKSTPVQEHAPAQHAETESAAATAAPAPAPAMPTPRISFPSSEAESDYSDYRKTNASIPAVNISGVDDDDDDNNNKDHDKNKDIPSIPQPPPIPEDEPSSAAQNPNRLSTRRDTRRMTFGLRPLPPEDPADNPEQRANRIRSFYKEYFDENKAAARETQYYEDYGSDYNPPEEEMGYDDEYYDDYYYPPVPAPFAEPDGRRAMTPPPRAPPRFQGHMGSGSIGGFSGFSGGGGGGGGSGNYYPGPRAMSSASNRLPGAARGPPRRPMPPPAPLNILPTPHMLKDDAIMSAIDFAPAKNFGDQREGRPDSPFGGKRPFSPAMRAATPLASSFNELSVMPSPHALRNSGAFTNLDFAPPPRFKTTETGGGSDTGSIRSNGTGGLSNMHHWNIRNGAYRVSRLPTGTVGTKDDMFNELRPKWDMRA